MFFCPRWGSEMLSWDDFLAKVKGAGYDGIEYGIDSAATDHEIENVWSKANGYGLKIIAQHYSTYDADVSHHTAIYARWLDRILAYKPFRINTQTGKDFFSFDQNMNLIQLANEKAAAAHIPLSHETHRNKFSFAAHITLPFLKKNEAMRLTLDLSHWVCVAESFLEDQPEAVNLAIERTDHLHARVGYPEGPQIPDPRSNQWQDALTIHLHWWDQLVEFKKKQRADVLTITPEFGPYPYMVHLPESNEPIASQWDVNVFMMNLLRDRYGK